MTAPDVLAVSDERDTWQQRLLDAERAAYRSGYADGRADERVAADRAWAARRPFKAPDGPDLAEVEALRWELRGQQRTRQTFGQPHPDDYEGGQR